MTAEITRIALRAVEVSACRACPGRGRRQGAHPRGRAVRPRARGPHRRGSRTTALRARSSGSPAAAGPAPGSSGTAEGRCGPIDLVVLDVLMPELDGLRHLPRAARQGRDPDAEGSRGEEHSTACSASSSAPTITSPSRSRHASWSRVSPRCCAADLAAKADTLRPARAARRRRGRRRPRSPRGARRRDVAAASPRPSCACSARSPNGPGSVLSRGQLIATVYGADNAITERTIDTHVRNLRAKLVAAGAPVIETVHGVGYRCI